MRLSRQAFLRRAGLVAGALPLAACGERPRRISPTGPTTTVAAFEVAVVGAGLAGLVCARRLGQAGMRPRVYEAAGRVGGRVWTIRDAFADGQLAERGGQFIDSRHRRMRSLCDELGLELVDLAATGPGGVAARYLVGDGVWSDNDVEAALGTIERAVTDGALRARTPDGRRELDLTTAAEWVERHVASPQLRTYLDVLLTAELGLDLGDQSALNVVWALADDDPEADERFRLRDGSDAVTAAIAGELPDLATGVALEAVSATAGGRYRLTVRDGSTTREDVVDHVVLALPFTALRHVELDRSLPLDRRLRRAIAELAMGTGGKLHQQYDARAWYDAGWDGDSLSPALGSTWEETFGDAGPGGVLVSFRGGRVGATLAAPAPAHGEAEPDVTRLLRRDLARLLPTLAGHETGPVLVDRWIDDPLAQGSYACRRPGQWTELPAVLSRPEAGIHFCGEHTSDDAQGYMEGACESGERAAREVLIG